MRYKIWHREDQDNFSSPATDVRVDFCFPSSIEDDSRCTRGSGAKMAKDTLGSEEVAKAILKIS